MDKPGEERQMKWLDEVVMKDSPLKLFDLG
jgi:hypothetical protein